VGGGGLGGGVGSLKTGECDKKTFKLKIIGVESNLPNDSKETGQSCSGGSKVKTCQLRGRKGI